MMVSNFLDSLLADIDDEGLRQQIIAEVEKLRDDKQFGLVYERHIPEYVRLPNHSIRIGSKVQIKTEKEDNTYTVLRSVGSESVLISPEGVEKSVDNSELVVIINHGSAIFPGLTVVSRAERASSKPFHSIINAENYHALQLLRYTHERKVDCIYIDPPYNTGNKTWKYNNRFVDVNDRFRHSKWLSFMEKRLLLCKPLLKRDSVIIITIDEHEVHRLALLLERIFPDASRIQMCTIVINPGGVTQPTFSRVEEYAIFCFFGDMDVADMDDDLLYDESNEKKQPIWFNLVKYGKDAKPMDRKNMVYPIGIDPTTKRISGVGPSLEDRINSGEINKSEAESWRPDPNEMVNGHTATWPISKGDLGRWYCASSTLISLHNDGFAKIGTLRKDGTGVVKYIRKGTRKKILSGEIQTSGREKDAGPYIVSAKSKKTRRKTVWNRKAHDAGKNGTKVLEAFVGENDFPFPKSPYAVIDCLSSVVGNNPNALILDFFAGSGTTFHSTCALNAMDGGSRTSISITNNELSAEEESELFKNGIFQGDPEFERQGIFHSITMPRCLAAVTGLTGNGESISGTYRDEYLPEREYSEGFEENAVFLEMQYPDKDLILAGKSFRSIAIPLWLKSGCIGPAIESEQSSFSVLDGANYAILFDINHWKDFVKELESKDGIDSVFIVTDSRASYQQVVNHLPPRVEATMLYEDYLTNFQIGG